MQGSFGVSILELISYIVPGGVLLAAILFRFQSIMPPWSGSTYAQVVFIVAAYILGHVLAVASTPIVAVRQLLQRILRKSKREDRYAFYPALRELLRTRFSLTVERNAEYCLCLRILERSTHTPVTAVERLRALTLFSRSMCACFIGLAAGAAMMARHLVSWLCMAGACVFFVRYVTFEIAMSNVVFESAYVELSAPA